MGESGRFCMCCDLLEKSYLCGINNNDLWAFFDKFPMNATLVAKQIGINASLMRQYIAGQKQPSKKRVEQIQEGIRSIGKQLSDISLVRY
mgnify:CR=1 FL=1